MKKSNLQYLNRKIVVAVYLEDKVEVGGGYHQALSTALLTRDLESNNFDIIFITPVPENISVLRDIGVVAILFRLTYMMYFVLEVRRQIQSQFIYRWFSRIFGDNSFEKFLKRYNVDLVYFLSPSEMAKSLDKTNFVFTLWDLAHRAHPEFPEVRNERLFEARERLYNLSLKRAVAVIVDSENGKKNAIMHYGLSADRVHVMPFSPAIQVDNHEELNTLGFEVRDKYHIDFDYIYYPAQFWAHKNHIYLIQAVKILEEKFGLRIGIVFSGGDAGGNRDYVERCVRDLGLCDRVIFTGFVSNEEIPHLYNESIALAMPTYFGPTNIPPLEAFRLGVPVLYPNLHDLRQQVGDAALLFDLQSPESCSIQIYRLLTEKNLRENLVAIGKIQLASMEIVDRKIILKNIFADFSIKRACWE